MKHYPTLKLGKDVKPAFKTCKIFRMAIEAMICSKLKLKKGSRDEFLSSTKFIQYVL
jgi:hypothetical protein